MWMANSEFGDYDRRVGYHQPRFSDEGFRRLARHGREVEWHRRLTRAITSATLDADLADTVPSRDVGGETVAARADGHVRGSGLRV